ncbi:MAG: VanZ family protein [Actinomycetota bacterium]|nr:VanZ family protein [Actinomycetota bacterium]
MAAAVGAGVWSLVVVWTSLAPLDPNATPLLPFSDKWLHTLAYAVLGFLVTLAMRTRRPVLVLCSIVVLGLALEVVQGQTGYRTYDLIDLLADAVGAFGGILAATGLLEITERRTRPTDAGN